MSTTAAAPETTAAHETPLAAAPTTLAERIAVAAETNGTITFLGSDPAAAVELPWSQLHEDARAMAAGLQARGIRPGDHVALLSPTSRGLVTAIQATWLAGATVVVLPLPMRLGSFEEFVAATRARERAADSALVVMDPDLAAFVEPAPGDPPVVLLPDLPGRADDLVQPPPDPDRLAVIQFTSGSTSDPKGVMLADRNILSNLDGVMVGAHFDPDDDVVVSWLPLYHDMGFLGMLTIPMITGAPLKLAGPQDFMSSPARWVEWMSRYGGTCTAGPNFSYALSARALRRLHGLDLTAWRIALNGAEPIDPATVVAFTDAGAPHGLDPGAAFPAFGMAEVTIGGTFPEPGSGLRVDVVDRRVLEADRYAAPSLEGPGTRSLPLLGRPLGDLQLRICDPQSGESMTEREVGELQIRGSAVTSGYYKRPAATAASFDGDWLRTGDLAYLVGGELIVCGRIKDVIIVGGRNVFPEDVERAAASVEGVRAGNVIAFGITGRRGREAVVVVAESRAGADADGVRKGVMSRVREAIGIPPEEILLMPAGSLPKTSSGKLQRSLCRDRYLESTLARA